MIGFTFPFLDFLIYSFFLKRIEKIIGESALGEKKKKARLKFNPTILDKKC